MKVKMNIRTKILTLFLATLLGVLVVLMLLVSSQSKSSVQEAVVETAQIVMKTASSLMSEELDSYLIAMKDLAAEEAFTGNQIDTEEAQKAIEACAERNGLDRVGYTDAKGINQKGLDFSEREYFLRAKESLKPVVSEVYASQTDNGAMSVLFAAPIIKENGSFGGIVYCASSCELLSDLLSQVSIGSSSYTFMLDSNGTVIAANQYDWVTNYCNFLTGNNTTGIFDTSVMANVSNSMVNGISGYDIFEAGDDTFFSVFAPVDIENGWSVCVSGNIEDFMTSYYSGIKNIFVVMVILFIVICIYVGYLGARMSKPILKSTDRMMLLAEGDLHSEVPNIKTLDETYILQKSIASTIAILNQMISEVGDILGKMAEGDFTTKIESEFIGDLLPLKNALNKILHELRKLLREIGATSNQVLFGAQNVAQLSESLASTVTEQTSIMENIRENVEDISNGADVNAKSANEAATVASQAMIFVEEGSQYMEELIEAMIKMEESSQAIEKINKTVSDIAFQTNILALNASVEAARAGTAGKGFAVVAEEVKSLAEKSAVASQDASELIQDTVSAIKNSMEVAQKTSASMQQVVEQTKQVDGHIGKIANMSQEQLDKLDQIQKSINEIADALSSTAASSQESAATAEELNAQATALEKMIQKFRV